MELKIFGICLMIDVLREVKLLKEVKRQLRIDLGKESSDTLFNVLGPFQSLVTMKFSQSSIYRYF